MPAAAPQKLGAADKRLRAAAEVFLEEQGLERAVVHRVERVERDVWWLIYVRRRSPWIAICTGEQPREWALLRTLEGWPVR